MSDDQPQVGTIAWHDLTVENADDVRDFYRAVVGWESSPVDMGGYSDYSMSSPGTDAPAAGICHARGTNASLPPQWLVYIVVADVERSAKEVTARGGALVVEPKSLGGGRFCVIRDPAGAVCALYQTS